jgi:serine/threonine-protein kinase
MSARDAHLAELFEQLISRTQAERDRFVASLRREDPLLSDDLESLLRAHESADGFFDHFSRVVLHPAMNAIGLDERQRDSNVVERLNAAVGRDYSIEREIGSGGMSRVFIASELRLNRKVVIKTLPQAVPQEVSVERFRREIQVAARLQNPHIVPLLTTGAADGFLYYVMPYVDGETLRARLGRMRALPVSEAIAIWRDVLDALAAAHAAGIVHRDVKPENILLSGRNALVADFGIARAVEASTEGADVTSPGVMLGTPGYMAPEQMREESSGDHRIDIYAAGLVMYEMLAGRNPFSGTNALETIELQRSHVAPRLSRPGLPSALVELIEQCMEKDANARPASAESIISELDAVKIRHPNRNRRIVAVTSIAAAALVLAAIGAFTLYGRPGPKGIEPGAIASDSKRSLLVMPIVNLTPDSGAESFSDGVTADLVARLAATTNLRVLPGAPVAGSRGIHRDPRSIAESLGIANMLDGTMQKTGSRLRMQVRLIDTRDGSTRWSEVFDRDMGDIFDVQNAISTRVARELDATPRHGPQRTTPSRYTPSVAAYEWYLRGMDVSLLRSNAGTRQAIEYFKKAIHADTAFAGAYAGLARMYLQIGNSNVALREWFARSESAAVKAVALDDSLPEAHVALGWALMGAGRMDRAELELKTAIALNPAAPRAHEGLARIYMHTGRKSEQLAEARAGVATDPLSYSAIRELALALNVNRRCDESLRILAPLKSLTPPAVVAGVIRGQCYAYKKMWPEAIAEFEWTLRNGNASVAPAFLAYALARGGREKEARKILADMLSNRTYSRGGFGIGIVYAGLRDYDRAFEWFEKGIAEGQSTQYIFDPMFEDLQRDPRFRKLSF